MSRVPRLPPFSYPSQQQQTQNTQEDETKRVDKELANIRQKFTQSNSMTSYNRKKYVWKLVYIFMLGYDVDFGHTEIVSLVGSAKYSEKQVGYVAMSLLLKAGDEMMNMVINSVRNDLVNARDDAASTLALTSIANVSGIELMSALVVEVQRVLVNPHTVPVVKKKAALCLLRLVRTLPEGLDTDKFQESVATLLQDRHLGVLTSTMSLLIGLTSKHEDQYKALIPYAIHILNNLVVRKNCPQEYLYYRTPCPWLQVKLLRFLQYYPDIIQSDAAYVPTIIECLNRILSDTENTSESINKSNADHAVLFEAINLIVIFGDAGDKDLQESAIALLGKFIAVREPNIRYLGLMTMSRLATLHDINKENIKRHQSTVVMSLKDADISVRRRALDLLFVMTDETNAVAIIDELITYLVTADEMIREQMVLKIAVLAEKYATDLKWYVDTMLKLISISGDHVSDAIWHRVIVIVTNNSNGDLQTYAASTIFDTVAIRTCHERAVQVGAYVLGEFGFLIAETAGRSGMNQFTVLNQHWGTVKVGTQALLLTTYAKLGNLYEDVRPLVDAVFTKLKKASHIELQQRASEYLAMRTSLTSEFVEDVLREMPKFDTTKVSTLEMRIKEEHANTTDNNVFSEETKIRRASQEMDNRAAVAKASAKHAAEQQASSPRAPIVSHQPSTEDLLDMGGSEPPRQQQQQQQQQNNPPPVPRSAGFDDGVGGSAAAPAAPQGIPPSLMDGVKSAWRKLSVTPAGLLYDSPIMQVGFKHEYKGSQGRVSLFLGNMGSTPMTGLSVSLPSSLPLLRTKLDIGDTAALAGGGGVRLEAKSRLTMTIMVEAMAPFTDSPVLTVSFECGGGYYEYPFRLPIVPTAFLEAVAPLDKETFMQRWGSLGGDKESQEVVQTGKAVGPADMARVLQIVTEGMKMARCPAVDAPNSVSAVGTFRTGSKDAAGNAINVGCLIRVDANGQAIRVTARTLNSVVSQAIKTVIVESLK